MTQKKFLEQIQKYYGPYPEGQQSTIIAYLLKCSDRYLDELYARVIGGFSSTYRVPPDVAIFEKYRGEILERLRVLPVPKRDLIEDRSTVISDEERQQVQNLLRKLAVKMNVRRRMRA